MGVTRRRPRTSSSMNRPYRGFDPVAVDLAAAELLIAARIDAFAQSEAHQQKFVALLLAAEG